MAYLRDQDMLRVSTFLHGLYACREAEHFAPWLLGGLSELVPSEQATFNHIAPCVPWTQVIACPEQPNLDQTTRRFTEHVGEHPVFQHYLKTGDPGAYKISDFVSAADYHHMPIYRRLYRELGYEDQMAMSLAPPASEITAVALGRRTRSFKERDRHVMNFIRPHLNQAWQNVRAFDRMNRQLRLHEQIHGWLNQAMVVLDDAGRIIQCSAPARQWLDEHFADGPAHARDAKLPPALHRWLHARTTSPAAPNVPVRPLIRTHQDHRLIVRLFIDRDPTRHVLLLERRATAAAADHLRHAGLTRREIEVMLQLDQGKTNQEIAAALHISLPTVKKHLEHIFNKLNVTHRTAAIARLRRRDT